MAICKTGNVVGAYQSTIIDNQTLIGFTYLQNQIQGLTAQCISGLPITSANQDVAIMKERFGQKHNITNAFIQSLIDLFAPRSSADSLRNSPN